MKLALAIAAAFATVSLAGPALAGPAEDIVAKEKCNKCHTEKTTKKGPSYAAIAKKYAGDAAAPAKLLKGLKEGGKMGDEEDHKKVPGSEADLKAVVALILSAK